jgi:cell division protein FtsQ
MDGGRRLLQSLREAFAGSPSLAYAGASQSYEFGDRSRRGTQERERFPAQERERFSAVAKSGRRPTQFFLPRGIEGLLTFILLAGVGFYGAVMGGQYAAFVAANGTIPDLVAKTLGFGIKAVTIAGERELSEQDLLQAAGIGPRNSLLFLDVAAIRERLKALPLIKEASVTKLYPDRILIEIEERQPFAVWQDNGDVRIVAADGMPIDSFHDSHFASLPFVVGDGANERIGEYLAILDALGDLRGRIQAGMLVSQRRWSLKVQNGVVVDLPEKDPQAAVATLIGLQRDYHVLDKDILSLDLRQAGRVVAHLTEEAAGARAALLARKAKPKGGQT